MPEPIAIVGMAVLFPGADSLENYWRNLVAGVDAITEVPSNRWQPQFYDPELADQPSRLYCRRGGFVDEFASFDPLPFGIMPGSVAETEMDQLLALRVAAAAMEDAGGADRLADRDRVGVLLGRLGLAGMASMKFYARVLSADQVTRFVRELAPEIGEERLDRIRDRITERLGPYHPENVIGLMSNLAASRIANRLNLRGPSYTVDAACASSLIAVDQAVTELTTGRLDAVVAGGVHHNHDISFWAVFNQLRALSRRQEIRPFDAGADGLLIGEGTGMVVLKRLSDAIRDKNRIYAVIRGVGVAGDGRSASLVNPETTGQVLAVRRAWACAGLDPSAPDAIGLLEAHGTGTPVGDAAEMTTMAEVFGPPGHGSPPVIGSVKSMIGHTMAAAGAAGLVKAALAISRGILLPTLHCDNPRPELEASRFRPISAAQPWESAGPRRAAVNAFGFGGINAHVILEQAPEPASVTANRAAPGGAAVVVEPEQIVLLAGPDERSVARMLDADDRVVRAYGAGQDANGTQAGGCRLGIVDPTGARLAAARRIVAAGEPWRGGRDNWFSPRPLLSNPASKIAFVFPGLEAEFSPQIADVIERFGLDHRGFSERDYSGHLASVIQAGCVLHDALERIGIAPDAVAGHSLGEWTAGIVAGLADSSTLDEQAATMLNPVAIRDDLLHAVIGEDATKVAARLTNYPGVYLSHDNAPAQSVVCGPQPRVRRLVEECGRQNVTCRTLPYATGVHTPYLEPYVKELREFDDPNEVRSARIPVWSGVIAAPLPDDSARRRELFYRQLLEPVRFRATMLAMYDAGFRVFLQVGPGQLASLIHETLRDREHLAAAVNVSSRSGLAQLRRVATALWAEGGTPDLGAIGNPGARAAKTATARNLRMRLELGAEIITLGEGAGDLLGLQLDTGSGLAHAEPDPDSGLATLKRLAARSPAAGEFAAMLEDAAASAAAVLTTAESPAAEFPAAEVSTTEPGLSAANGHRRYDIRVGLETMPYLVDHAFHLQPPGWPEPADTMPVVPAAAILQHMIDTVQAAVPGMVAVGAEDVQLRRWALAEPAHDVEITMTPDGPGRFAVSFGPYAKATILLADGYPADPPPVWEPDPAEEPAALSAERMYAERVEFHGPSYRGVAAVHGQTPRSVRGTIRALPSPGAPFDAGLQLMGNWLHVTQPSRTLGFPVGIGSVRFFGPPPADGELLGCIVRLTDINRELATGDMQFSTAQGVWAQVKDSVNRRFDSHPRARAAERAPGRVATSFAQPAGWVALFDYWPDPATQQYIVRLMSGERGYREFDRQPVAHRKRWLLGRIAVKDAARLHVWETDGAREIFPIEVDVNADSDGRAVTGGSVPGLRAAFAHASTVAVAIVGPPAGSGPPGEHGLGIGVAEVTDVPPRTPLTAPEESVLAAVAGSDRSLWLARLLAARDAAAQARGPVPGTPGPDGLDAPGLPRITGADPAVVSVTTGNRVYRVRHSELSSPDEKTPRRYVVAWIPDMDPNQEDIPL